MPPMISRFPLRNHPRPADAGLTLLELTVAILVLAIASLAALKASDQSRRAIGGEMPRLLARIAAQNRVEELALHGPNGAALPSRVQVGGQGFSLSTRREATRGGLVKATVNARADSGEGVTLVTYLIPGSRP